MEAEEKRADGFRRKAGKVSVLGSGSEVRRHGLCDSLFSMDTIQQVDSKCGQK